MYLFLSILIGYFLGSINPAYFFGRLIKKQDIRQIGTHNAGATNVYKSVGIFPAIITVIFDLGKGLLAIYIAWRLGVQDPWYLLAGLGAFLGHVFPFYLGFRGGQGVAVLMSLFFYLCFRLFHIVTFPYAELGSLIGLVLILIYVANKGDVLGLTVIPLFWLVLVKLIILHPQAWFYLVIIFAMFVYMFYTNLSIILKEKIVHIKPEVKDEMLHWRTLARPLAVLIPVIYFYFSQEVILWILGIIGLVLIAMDLTRLLISKVNWFLFNRLAGFLKNKEHGTFSSLTYFIVACFLAVLFFSQPIAALAIVFMVFGDVGAKFFGGQYSRTYLFRNRSLEGLLVYFGFSLFLGAYVGTIYGVAFWLVAVGAATAALTDLFSIFGLDDNFTVALISGAVMTSALHFIS